MPGPRTGPCSPWISGENVASIYSIATAIKENKGGWTVEQTNGFLAEAVAAATEILYKLSGRLFTGVCTDTYRPLSRPRNVGERRFTGESGAYVLDTWGGGVWYDGMSGAAIASHFGDSEPPQIAFDDYPIRDILSVYIDGILIPPDEYELRDNRTLVRMLPSASAIPTARFGWPTAQRMDLPDTELGTFSVTATHGVPPPPGGILACKRYSEILCLPMFGDTRHYPQRFTTVNRQGVSMGAVDVIDILAKGETGVYEVDAWIMSVNPQKQRVPSLVLSPDVARTRRQAGPSRAGGL